MNEQKPKIDILDDSESMLRKVLRLGWPTVLSMFLHTSYVLADMFWVAKLEGDSVNNIAALSLTGLLMFGLFAISQMFSSGVLALVARAHGAKEYSKAGAFLRDGIVTGSLAGAFCALIISIYPAELLGLLRAEAPVIAVGTPYVRIMGLSAMASIPLFTLTAGFRGAGDMITPLVLTAVSCILNILLDPILILGAGPFPAMGLSGAGIATVSSIVLALFWGITMVMRKSSIIKIHWTAQPSVAGLKDLFAVGFPAGLHYVLLMMTQSVMLFMVTSFGTAAVAAAGVGARISNFAFLPAIGLGAATSTLVGQYLGANRVETAVKATRTAVRATFAITVLISFLFSHYSESLVKPFAKGNAEVLMLGAVFLKMFALTMLFISTIIILTRVFQGAGDTVGPTVIAAIRFLLFIPLGWFFGWVMEFETVGVWLGMLLSAVSQAILIIWIYNRGSWKQRKLASVQDQNPS